MPGNTGQDGKTRPASPRSPKDASAAENDTGAALRSVYQKTVEESVPDAMLDLLGRLD